MSSVLESLYMIKNEEGKDVEMGNSWKRKTAPISKPHVYGFLNESQSNPPNMRYVGNNILEIRERIEDSDSGCESSENEPDINFDYDGHSTGSDDNGVSDIYDVPKSKVGDMYLKRIKENVDRRVGIAPPNGIVLSEDAYQRRLIETYSPYFGDSYKELKEKLETFTKELSEFANKPFLKKWNELKTNIERNLRTGQRESILEDTITQLRKDLKIEQSRSICIVNQNQRLEVQAKCMRAEEFEIKQKMEAFEKNMKRMMENAKLTEENLRKMASSKEMLEDTYRQFRTRHFIMEIDYHSLIAHADNTILAQNCPQCDSHLVITAKNEKEYIVNYTIKCTKCNYQDVRKANSKDIKWCTEALDKLYIEIPQKERLLKETTKRLEKVEKLYKEARPTDDLENCLNNDDDKMCCICMENEPNSVFIPCGHVCICDTCGKKPYSKCPICRKNLTGQPIRIYLT